MTAPPARRRPLFGTVAEFDGGRGLGTVTSDGGERFGFHATAIADGSRRIAPGTEVAFVAVAGHRGRVEARGLTPARREDAVGGRTAPPAARGPAAATPEGGR